MVDETGAGSVCSGDDVGGRADAEGEGLEAAELDAELERIGRLVQAAPEILIRLTQIQPDASQPRTSMDEGGLQSLAESIRTNGLLNPIHVYSIGLNSESGEEEFKVACGHRRLRALLRLGRSEAPCKILPPEVIRGFRASSLALSLRQHDENSEAEGLSRWDECGSIGRMLDEIGACMPNLNMGAKIAWLSAKKRAEASTIYDRLSLLESPPALRDVLRLPVNHPGALTWRGALAALREARASRRTALKGDKLQRASTLLKAVAKAAGQSIPGLATGEDVVANRATPEFDRALRDHCAERGERLEVVNKSLDGLMAALGAWDRTLAREMGARLDKAPGKPTAPVKKADGASSKKASGAGKRRKPSAQRKGDINAALSEGTTPSEGGSDEARKPAPGGASQASSPRLFTRNARRTRFVVEEAVLRQPGAATRENLLELGTALEEFSTLVREAVRAIDAAAGDTERVA